MNLRQSAKRWLLIVLLTAGAVLAAEDGNQVWTSPKQAVRQSEDLKSKVKAYAKRGFELSDQFANAFRYKEPRQGSYDWGIYIYSLKRSGADNSGDVRFVTITANIRYDAGQGGYLVTHYEVSEESLP